MLRLAKYVSDSFSGAISDHVSASDWVSLSQSNSIVWTMIAISAIAVLRNVKTQNQLRLAKVQSRR